MVMILTNFNLFLLRQFFSILFTHYCNTQNNVKQVLTCNKKVYADKNVYFCDKCNQDVVNM